MRITIFEFMAELKYKTGMVWIINLTCENFDSSLLEFGFFLGEFHLDLLYWRYIRYTLLPSIVDKLHKSLW